MIDLHMHTIYSDGSKTVEEMLKMAEEKKLEYISITDHNTCAAYYDEALKNNKFYSGSIIKGVELNAQFQNRAIEILGYDINPDIIMEWSEKYFSIEAMKNTTKKVYDRFINILDKKGIIYNKEDIRPQKDEEEFIERPIWEEVVKHPENKEILGEEYFNSIRMFFRKEIANPDSEYFLNRVGSFPTAKEVVEIIHKAGGKAFFAHPFECNFQDTIGFINDLIAETKLDGIECYHPSSETENKSEILLEYAKKNNLYISGGSDYHGKLKPEIELGAGYGGLNIPKEIIEAWIKA